MPLPTLFPGHDPTTTPATALQSTLGAGEGGGVGGFVVREIIGVNIAFASPALTDSPLWIRLDDPGSI